MSLDKLLPGLSLALGHVTEWFTAVVYRKVSARRRSFKAVVLTAKLVKVCEHLRRLVPGHPGKDVQGDVLVLDVFTGC